MNVLIVTDIRLITDSERILLEKQFYYIFERYFKYFGPVSVFCGKEKSTNPVETSDGSRFFKKTIFYSSLSSIIIGKSKKALLEEIKKSDLVIGRFHSISAIVAARFCRKLKKPFLAEVMGDAWDGYWNHGLAGKIVALPIYLGTKKAIKNANYALYVTKSFLQKRYPCDGFVTHASNVKLTEIDESALKSRELRIDSMPNNEITLMTSANVDVRAKGHKYVIKAIPILKHFGIKVTYYIAGGGDKDYLSKIAKKYKVYDSVVFLGRLSVDEVFNRIDKTDFYIQPSLQEGVPRAVIEAMSRGCVCLGAKTGGIPELLGEAFIFKRKSAKSISQCILKCLSMDLKVVAHSNFINSKSFLQSVLDERRNAFFNTVKDNLSAN